VGVVVSALLELVFAAKTAMEAEQLARDWAAAEPNIRLERVTRVRPAKRKGGQTWQEWVEHWTVEIAYVVISEDQQTLGLGV
jgi:hypothetical protein